MDGGRTPHPQTDRASEVNSLGAGCSGGPAREAPAWEGNPGQAQSQSLTLKIPTQEAIRHIKLGAGLLGTQFPLRGTRPILSNPSTAVPSGPGWPRPMCLPYPLTPLACQRKPRQHGPPYMPGALSQQPRASTQPHSLLPFLQLLGPQGLRTYLQQHLPFPHSLLKTVFFL